jgi:hypothetical protein
MKKNERTEYLKPTQGIMQAARKTTIPKMYRKRISLNSPVRKFRTVYPDVFYRDRDLNGGHWETGVSTTTTALKILLMT